MRKPYYLKIIKYLRQVQSRIQTIDKNQDLAELHRLSVELQTRLPENVVHENRVMFLDGLRVNSEMNISEYLLSLRERINYIINDYRVKAEKII